MSSNCEETSPRVGSLAAYQMLHDDPNVGSVAASALTQMPNRPRLNPLLSGSPHVCPTCGQDMLHAYKQPTLADFLRGALPQAPVFPDPEPPRPALGPYEPGTLLAVLAELLQNGRTMERP
jgi:hypothetical protein